MGGWNRARGVTRRRAVLGMGVAGIAAVATPTSHAAAQTPVACAADLEANKDLVRRFYAAFYGARVSGDVDAIDAFVSSEYVQHEPGVPPGRDGLKQLIRNAAGRSPEPPPVLHLVADGDIIVAHQIVPGADPNGPLAAEGIDIFRIVDGRLVEHWGVDAEYPQDDPTPGAATPEA